jgi:hypothetical protein
VLASAAQAHSIGVTGVPGFLLDRRLLVLGAQPRPVFEQALQRLTGNARPNQEQPNAGARQSPSGPASANWSGGREPFEFLECLSGSARHRREWVVGQLASQSRLLAQQRVYSAEQSTAAQERESRALFGKARLGISLGPSSAACLPRTLTGEIVHFGSVDVQDHLAAPGIAIGDRYLGRILLVDFLAGEITDVNGFACHNSSSFLD